MTFRSCRSALLSVLLLCAAFAHAQTTAPASTPAAAKKPKEGYFRFWNMLPRDGGDLVLLHDNGTPEGDPLLHASPLNYHADYLPVPLARYALKVVRRTDQKLALETFDVLVRADVYVTFLAQLVDGKVTVEMLDDTYAPEKAVAGRLTVRHFFPAATVQVTSSLQLASRALTHGESQTIEGFPLQPVMIEMRATMANGKTQTWSSEVDFSRARHASLLVVPDPYGRFRPRVSIDGRAAGGTPQSPP